MSEDQLARSDFWFFDADRWPVYRRVIEGAQHRGIPFCLGGGFASMAYTGIPRKTKDMDLFMLERDRQAMIAITSQAGLRDYFPDKPYDRSWIYRATDGEIIVDLIWAMANHRSAVDTSWIAYGPEVRVDGVRVRIMTAEDVLWTKLYILQKDRCDWPEALNVLYAQGPDLDWQRVLARVGTDRTLLSSLIALFSWLAADRARQLPGWLWKALDLKPPGDADHLKERAAFLDSRSGPLPAWKQIRRRNADRRHESS